MAVATTHVLHGIKNDSLFLSQISNARITPGISQEFVRSAGFHLPLGVVCKGQAPGITFSCRQISTLLAATGASLVSLAANPTYLYFKKATQLSTRVADATTSHTRLVVAMSGLCTNRITAGHQTIAVAEAMLPIVYDGTNEPIVPAGSVALAGTPAAGEQYFAGPLSLNTVAYEGVQDLTIDFGLNIRVSGGDGELYPTFTYEVESFPVITARVKNLPWTTIGLNGLTLTAFSCYLRLGDDNSRIANATTSHIKFSGTAGTATIEDTSGGDNNDCETTIRIACVAPNASGVPLTVATGSAIS